MALKFSSPTFRRVAAAIGVASLAILTVAPTANASVTKATKIDTYSDWDGVSVLQPWGNPDTSTYGQTITVGAGDKKLKNFTFYMETGGITGTITFNGEVYGWDGTKATTQVFESKVKSVDLTAGDPTFKKVTIKTKGAKVTPGQQYVLFLSVSKTYEQTDPGVLSQWACNYSDVLPGGNTVYLNDTGDESQWTTATWSQISSFDMAFTATLK